METNNSDTQKQSPENFHERRITQDRRQGHDRRDDIRFEKERRSNHGRRKEDKDPWKESLEFD
ncbi:hypothetical protein [Amphritea balenae]|uniref:Uncharacterized protein n=1 Tax=Amphritea balenae TaxID=452629 RepID=A0A3P1SVA4_9GAMM|nr:hypothetical protein [Amphritea balenae]RRD01144.1 hypothetical protein EHS89_00860 [Amphritea balenae]GGK59530.1 hypothetical protein GCM10007941_07250 [Amphritea balenae]